MEINAFRKVQIGKIRAKVDIRTKEGIIIKGFKVIEGENGLFVGMPSERTRLGKYVDTVQIPEEDTREMLVNLILDEYERRMGKEE
ncbi:MAG: septation regulator SpoVG [Calditrichia bacterium]